MSSIREDRKLTETQVIAFLDKKNQGLKKGLKGTLIGFRKDTKTCMSKTPPLNITVTVLFDDRTYITYCKNYTGDDEEIKNAISFDKDFVGKEFPPIIEIYSQKDMLREIPHREAPPPPKSIRKSKVSATPSVTPVAPPPPQKAPPPARKAPPPSQTASPRPPVARPRSERTLPAKESRELSKKVASEIRQHTLDLALGHRHRGKPILPKGWTSSTPPPLMPLPRGWEKKRDKQNNIFYKDHRTGDETYGVRPAQTQDSLRMLTKEAKIDKEAIDKEIRSVINQYFDENPLPTPTSDLYVEERIPGDGNCFYYAILRSLQRRVEPENNVKIYENDPEVLVAKFKNLVRKFSLVNRNLINRYLIHPDTEKLQDLMDNGVYAEEFSYQAIANYLECCIYIFIPEGESSAPGSKYNISKDTWWIIYPDKERESKYEQVWTDKDVLPSRDEPSKIADKEKKNQESTKVQLSKDFDEGALNFTKIIRGWGEVPVEDYIANSETFKKDRRDRSLKFITEIDKKCCEESDKNYGLYVKWVNGNHFVSLEKNNQKSTPKLIAKYSEIINAKKPKYNLLDDKITRLLEQITKIEEKKKEGFEQPEFLLTELKKELQTKKELLVGEIQKFQLEIDEIDHNPSKNYQHDKKRREELVRLKKLKEFTRDKIGSVLVAHGRRRSKKGKSARRSRRNQNSKSGKQGKLGKRSKHRKKGRKSSKKEKKK